MLELSREEAEHLGQRWLGTEHLLLGLAALLEEERVSAPSFFGERLAALTPDNLRGIVANLVTEDSDAKDSTGAEQPRPTPRTRRVLERARVFAFELGHDDRVDVEHILLGLLHETGGIADHALRELGVTYEKLIAISESRLDSARTLGETLPPPTHRDVASGEKVFVEKQALPLLTSKLPKMLPPGTAFGWNLCESSEEGEAFVIADATVDLKSYVERALLQ